jgi:REP element-mobilizing transposase RayT
MSRQPRISFPGAHYHLLNRFVDRHPFFQADQDYRCFLDTFFELAPLHGIRTYAYCLMPNHFHIVLETTRGGMSQFLQQAMSRVAHELNKRHDRVGHLFQDRSKTFLIEEGAYFETVVGYVLLNPVRAGICRDVLAYPWSSATLMVKGGGYPVETRLLAERLSGEMITSEDVDEQRAILMRWLRRLESEARAKAAGHETASDDLTQSFREGVSGTFCGSSQFRKRVLMENERRLRFEQGRKRRITDRDFTRVTWVDLGELAASLCAQAPEDLISAWRDQRAAIADLRIVLAHHVANWTFDRIRREDGDRQSEARYSVAMSRLKAEPRKKEMMARALERVVSGSYIPTFSEA